MNWEKRLYHLVIILFLICGAYITVKYCLEGNYFLALGGPVSLLYLLIPPACHKILGIKLDARLKSWIIMFCLIGFDFGVVLRWYDQFLFYDKFVHFLSGILFTVIGFCLYSKVAHGKVNRKSNWLLQGTYALFFSLAVAVIWETGEFAAYLITGHDMQHTLTTGVFDTMYDMITCTLGSLLVFADYILYVKTGVCSPIFKTVQSFDRFN